MAANAFSPDYKPTGSNDDDINHEWLLMWGANDLRQNDHLVDVTLIVNGKKLKPCHRVILAASSPYFRAMFTHNVTEQNQEEIEIKGLDYSSVSSILDYLYTSKADIDDSNAQDLLTASSILQVIGLYGKCRKYMQRRLSLENCLEVYNFAKTLCCTELQNDAFALVTGRFVEIIGTKEFLNLCKDDLIDFISADELSVEKEEIVYEAVLAWLLHDVSSRGRMISEVFSHVRMTLLSEEYLNQCILQEEALEGFPNLHSQAAASQKYKKLLKERKDSVSEDETSDKNSVKINKALSGSEIPLKCKTDMEDNKAILNGTDLLGEQPDENALKIQQNVLAKSSTENEDKLKRHSFTDFPFYEVNVSDAVNPVKIPLTVVPRAGMFQTDVLIFTNGRKTVLFNPLNRQYFCGDEERPGKVELTNREDDSTQDHQPGVDLNMPEMKNAEVYASQDGIVYLIGGLEVAKSASVTSLQSKVFTFDVERLKWTQCAPLIEPRAMMGLGEMTNKFYVSGGKALSHGQILSCVHVYSRDENTWSETVSMPTALYGHGCASVKDRLYVIGGKREERVITNSVIFLEAKTNQWTEAAHLQVPRFLAGITVLRTPLATKKNSYREVIYIVGGVADEGPLSSVETFNPEKDRRWMFGEEFPGNRCAQTLATIGGNVCAIGGHVTERSHGGRFESIQKFDAFLLESVVEGDVIEPACHWRRLVRHIRGISGMSCACAGFRVDTKRINISQ